MKRSSVGSLLLTIQESCNVTVIRSSIILLTLMAQPKRSSSRETEMCGIGLHPNYFIRRCLGSDAIAGLSTDAVNETK